MRTLSADEHRLSTEVPSDEETLVGTGDGVTARREITLERGASVGRYVVIERIGAGAMGVVYKAFDPELDRVVAIKLLLGDGSRKGGSSRLQREAQAMARIAHPNVIAVHDVGTVGERVFVAMELVDGEPLGAWLKRTTPTATEILEEFRKARAGIPAAHVAGVIHRDFKPDNVLVDQLGRPRVLDFGLARQGAERTHDLESGAHLEASTSFDTRLTQTGAVMGTPAYMAPEQFAGEPSDERTDQFAFCVALHEALTGERPFRSYSFATLSAAVIRGERAHTPAAEALDPAISAALDRGLQTNPDERFASMSALLDALSPGERSPAGLVFVGVAVLAAATAAAYGLGVKNAAPAAEPEPCADAGAEMVALWTEDRREAVLSAFERSGAFNGAPMGARVVSVLDEHAAAWTEAAGRSCAMAGADRVFTEEIAFRSQRCLEGSFSAFEDITDSLQSVDARGVQSSLSAVEGLPRSASCNEVSWLELQVRDPLDPELRASVSKVSLEVNAAHDAWQAHDAERCLAQLSAVEPRVRELGFGPEVARLLAIRAECELGSGNAKAAEKTRERAFEAALGAADDITALKISTTTAHVLATTTDEFDAAETWIRRAEALLERHSVKHSMYLVAVANVRGILAGRQHQTELAIEHFKRVAELSVEDSAGAERYVTGMLNVGVALANAKRLDEAAAAFRSSVDFASEHWGPQHENAAAGQTKLAQVLEIQGRFVESRAAHIAAMDSLRAANDEAHLPLAYALLSLGIVELNLGNLAAAKGHYEEAHEIRDQLDALETSEAAPLFTARARLATLEGDHEAAERWSRRALDVRKNAPGLVRATSLGVLAAVRIKQGDEAEARALNQDAETLVLSANRDVPAGDLGPALYTVARNWGDLGNRPRALELFEQAEQSLKGQDYQHQVSSYRLAYARLLQEVGDTERAREIVQAALDELAASPYPKDVLAEAKALRDELQP